MIPIEGARGCHWNRCHFCFLNQGYKYRRKSAEVIKEEILYNIKNILFTILLFWIMMLLVRIEKSSKPLRQTYRNKEQSP